MPTCGSCKREYDNGTNSLHGCDPEDLEDLKELTDAGEIALVTDPDVVRFGLEYEVLEEYRKCIAAGMTPGHAHYHACFAWDV